jgi:HEXXH motif-containing protein
MRSRLADSLEYIFGEAHSHVSVSRERMEAFLLQLRSKPVSPLAFSFYCDIVLAIEEDNMEVASALFETLTSLPAHPGGPVIVPLGDTARDPLAERTARFMNADPETPHEAFAPPAEVTTACRARVGEAMALMEAGDPALAAEHRILIREITLAAGKTGPGVQTFDAASSFMLWGGIIFNANRIDDAFGMLQSLAHETAHNLLFAFCVDEPVLENGFEGRYDSPLRKDPRPLEGIYHSVFVLARMHRAAKHLVDSGVLSGPMREKALAVMANQARLFAGGMDTVRKHGKMTATGEAVIRGACAYMEPGGG